MPYSDPDKQRAYQNEWLKRKRRSNKGGAVRNNRRRTRAKQMGVELKDIAPDWEVQQLLRQGFMCHWCDKHIGCRLIEVRGQMQVDFEADHVVPLAEGGEHSEDNLVLACVSCNRGREAERKKALRSAPDDGEVL